MEVRGLSLLAPVFVPGDRPERWAKAAASGADAVILDLEDAVAPEAKMTARRALTTTFTDLPVIVRVNGVGTPWHDDDIAAVAQLDDAVIMLPKAETVADLAAVARFRRVMVLIETAAGLAGAREFAISGHVEQIAFGSIDYASDLGCAHSREALASARAELVLASRLAGLSPPLDGVTTDIIDPQAAEDDARHARALGFGGKLAIHPCQIAAIRRGFLPTSDEVAWAMRVVAVTEGVASVDGAMVDAPVRARAQAILARRRVGGLDCGISDERH